MLEKSDKSRIRDTIRHSRPWITADDVDAISQVAATGMLASGPLTKLFEQQVAKRCDLAEARFVASGRYALVKALQLIGIAPEHEVLIPTYVCHSVRDAVKAVGAVPVLCDAGSDWCLDPHDVANRIGSRTRAIVVAHTFGIAADMDQLMGLGLPVIEDCAQAFGGKTADGRQLGSIGMAGIYSLHPTKPLTAGTGGIVGSADAKVAAKLRAASSADFHDAASPVTDLAAALGLSQLARYDLALERRRAIARRYFDDLAGLDAQLPAEIADQSIFFRFPLRVRRTVEAVMAAFAEHGVIVRRGVDTLLHRLPGADPAQFPGAEACFNTTISIPIYPALTDDNVRHVIAAARNVLGTSP